MRFIQTKELLLVCLILSSVFLIAASCDPAIAADPTPGQVGRTSIGTMNNQYVQAYPEASFLQNDIRDSNNNPIPTLVNPAAVPGVAAVGSWYPLTTPAQMSFMAPSSVDAAAYVEGMTNVGGFDGFQPNDLKTFTYATQGADFLARIVQYPANAANQARAQTLGQSQAMSNAMGDIAKGQAASAMSYCSGFLQNFTVQDGNIWNQIRNNLFLPIAILLFLPGAILTQTKATISCGNVVISQEDMMGDMIPLEGILRSIIAIFLIPGTYLIVNYGIDFSNSITYSMANAYSSIMGGDMYNDALSSEVSAFPVRTPSQNQNAGQPAIWPQSSGSGIAGFEENFIANLGTNGSNAVPTNKTDDAMPAGAVAARGLAFGANAALTAAWNVLCAFQMAYLAYLFFVGPVVAALWVWPNAQFRQALPSWIEGVLTLCFWSMFWNTVILLMACFKGTDPTGTVLTSALNFLAVSSVKYAFDFGSLVRDAGMTAAQQSLKKNQSNGAGRGSPGAVGKAGAIGKGGGGGGAPGGDPGQGIGLDGSDPDAQYNNMGTQPGAVLASSYGPAGGLATDAGYSPADVAPPPLALTPGLTAPGMQLAGYTLPRGLDGNGIPVVMLRAANGQMMPLAANMTSGQTIPTPNGSPTYQANGNDYSYPLIDTSGQRYNSGISAIFGPAGTPQAPVIPGALDPGGDPANDSIMLASADGIMFLENNGRTLRMGGANGPTYSLEPGASQGRFELPGGRTLTLSQNANGNGNGNSEQITIANTQAGTSESFSVIPNPNSPREYELCRSENGTLAGYTQVSYDGLQTSYVNEDASGHVLDMHAITPNGTNSTYFARENGQLVGNVATAYQQNGDSTTSYHNAGGHLIASAEHLCKESGGSVDIVRDSAGQIASMQDVTPAPDGGYTVQTSQFDQGSPVSSLMSTYDAHSALISSVPVGLPPTLPADQPLSQRDNPYYVRESMQQTTYGDTPGAIQPLTYPQPPEPSPAAAYAGPLVPAGTGTEPIDYPQPAGQGHSDFSVHPSSDPVAPQTPPQPVNTFTSLQQPATFARTFQSDDSWQAPANNPQSTNNHQPTGLANTDFSVNSSSVPVSPGTTPQSQSTVTSVQQPAAFARTFQPDDSWQAPTNNPQPTNTPQLPNTPQATGNPQPTGLPNSDFSVNSSAVPVSPHTTPQPGSTLMSRHQETCARSVVPQTAAQVQTQNPQQAKYPYGNILGKLLSHPPGEQTAPQPRITDIPLVLAALSTTSTNSGKKAPSGARGAAPKTADLSGQTSASADKSGHAPPVKPHLKGEETHHFPPYHMVDAPFTKEQLVIPGKCQEGHSSLQDQLMASAKPPRSKTLNQILSGSKSPADIAEAIASAQVNYKLVASMLTCGRVYQAQELLNIVAREIELISHNEEAKPLIEAYISLMKRHHMNAQAQAFQNTLQDRYAQPSSTLSAW